MSTEGKFDRMQYNQGASQGGPRRGMARLGEAWLGQAGQGKVGMVRIRAGRLVSLTAMLFAIGAHAQNTVSVTPGGSIQSAIDAAPAGSTIQLSAGTWSGQSFQLKSGDTLAGQGTSTVLNGNGMSSPA